MSKHDGSDLEGLLDKQALYENLLLYVRGVDRMDLELMKSTYWADSGDDHGRFVGTGHEWCEEAFKRREAIVSNNHHIGNVYSEIDGTRAKRESMFINVVTYREGDKVLMSGGVPMVFVKLQRVLIGRRRGPCLSMAWSTSMRRRAGHTSAALCFLPCARLRS